MNYRKVCISSFLIILALNSCTILNPYIRTLKKIDKGQFDRASFHLSQIKKDSTHSALEAYVHVLHFKKDGSPFRELDSAIKWAHIGDSAWMKSKSWEKSFVIRKSENSDPFKTLIEEIDSLGFVEAKKHASEKIFIDYLNNFPNSRFYTKAIELRDSCAFYKAKRENTYLAYKNFIEKYPDSKQIEEAKEIYELLLYETHTRDQHKISYENFIKKFPHSPFKEKAEEKVFELYTLDHRVSSFENFIDAFPNSFKVDEAKLWIRHKKENYDSIEPIFLFPQKDKSSYLLINPEDSLIKLEIDSIKNHFACDPYRQPYIIYSKSDKWGLANSKGEGRIPPLFHDLEKLENDIYIYSNGLKKGLVHVSGFRICDALYDGFEVLNDTFISVQLEGNKALAAKNGKLLSDFAYDQIYDLEKGLHAIKKDKKWAIVKASEFLKWPDMPKLKFAYDSVYRSEYGRLLTGGIANTLLLNNDLDTLIDYSFRLVSETENFIQTFDQVKYDLFDNEISRLASSETEIYFDQSGFAFKSDSLWKCYFYSDTFSVDLFESFNSYYKKLFISDSVFIYNKRGRFPIVQYDKINTQIYKINETDTFCFVVGNDNNYGLINAIGDTLIPLEWDEIKVFDSNAIRVSKKAKYGLYNFEGKELLKPEFDAISNYSEGALALYKNNKFGLIQPQKSIYIPCKYTSSLKLIDLKFPFFTVQLNSELRLYNTKNKEIAIAKDFVVLNDSLILFNQDFTWKLMKLNENAEFESLGINALRYRIWEDGLGNNHLIYETVNGYGFYNTVKNENIYPEFFMLYPFIGRSGEIQNYLAFKHFEEIDLFLLKLLDSNGFERDKTIITADQAANLGCGNLLDKE
ncbi:MAG: WG repeat-containing protein [Cytophagales bacterium]